MLNDPSLVILLQTVVAYRACDSRIKNLSMKETEWNCFKLFNVCKP